MAKRRKNSAASRFKRLDRLRRSMSDSEILRELTSAMTNSEIRETANYIADNWDLHVDRNWDSRFEAVDSIVAAGMNESQVLEEMVMAMSDRDAKENFNHIERMRGLASNPGGQRKKRKRNPEKETMASIVRRLKF